MLASQDLLCSGDPLFAETLRARIQPRPPVRRGQHALAVCLFLEIWPPGSRPSRWRRARAASRVHQQSLRARIRLPAPPLHAAERTQISLASSSKGSIQPIRDWAITHGRPVIDEEGLLDRWYVPLDLTGRLSQQRHDGKGAIGQPCGTLE